MTTYTWEYGDAAAGLQFTIAFDDSTDTFTVTSLAGSFDLNALWFSDGNTTSDGYTLIKSDNSLNMNGSDTVWDDGTSSAQTIVWDTYGKLSSTGLGSEGVNKTSFISDGETQTFDLSDFELTSFDPTTFDTLGVRATSVNGTGAIKWVDETPETGQGPLVPGIAQITNTAVDEVLNDISGGGTFERVVYSASGSNGDFDVLAFTYTPPPSLGGGLHTLNGTFQVVNNGPGDQTNPHVSGDIAAYTSDDGVNSQIRYFDFATSSDHLVPTTGPAFLSDVSDGRIVYTEFSGGGPHIGVFDTSDSTTTIIPGGNQRSDPSIGSNLVGFEDRSLSGNGTSEIVTYDLATNTATRLTNDALQDINPEISADGNHVVFQKTDTSGLNSDVYVSDQTSPGVFSTTNISATLPTNGEELTPSISGDGRFVTWSSTVSGDSDIYILDRDTNTTHQFDLPGDQINPSITEDGRHIAFESNQAAPEFDIYLADNPLHDDFIM